MFSGVTTNAWIVGTIVAVTAGCGGFLRGDAVRRSWRMQSRNRDSPGSRRQPPRRHTIRPRPSRPAECARDRWLGKRGQQDAVTALAVVLMLGLGALFLSWTTEYAPAVFSLLFGEVLGVSTTDPRHGSPRRCVCGGSGRPVPALLLTSVIGEPVGARPRGPQVEMCFLVVVAIASTMAVPVVGALLMFSLMVGPPAASRYLANNPPRAIALSVAMALVTVWAAIAASYASSWPIGFFVGTIGASCTAGPRLVGLAPQAGH